MQFEVCINAHPALRETHTAITFVRATNGNTVTEEFALDPQRGGCYALPYNKAGDEPVFAILDTANQTPLNTVLASATLQGADKQLQLLQPQQLVDDGGAPGVSSFGPLRLNHNERLQVCVNNLRSQLPARLSIRFYATSDSRRAFHTRDRIDLEPAEGGCASVEHRQTGERSFFAQVLTRPDAYSVINPLVISGAFIVDSTDGRLKAPVPASSQRYLPNKSPLAVFNHERPE
jgi:hypothetical protein